MRNKILVLLLITVAIASAPFVLAKTLPSTPPNKNSWATVYATIANLSRRVSALEATKATTAATPPTTTPDPSAVNPTPAPVPVVQAPDPIPKPPKRKYKVLVNVDICTLNKLGQDGWEIVSPGNPVDLPGNLDENCNISYGSTYKGLDSAILQRVEPTP
ncbi:MAG: hypothetical protein NVSMB66_6060 [Candidatus Doudnabacteria bacterium]